MHLPRTYGAGGWILSLSSVLLAPLSYGQPPPGRPQPRDEAKSYQPREKLFLVSREGPPMTTVEDFCTAEEVAESLECSARNRGAGVPPSRPTSVRVLNISAFDEISDEALDRWREAGLWPGDFWPGVVGYDRKLCQRWAAGVNGGVRKLFQDGPDPKLDLNASIYVRYRLGDLL